MSQEDAKRHRKLNAEIANDLLRNFSAAERDLRKAKDEQDKQSAKDFTESHNKLREEFVNELEKSLDAETKKGNLDNALEIRSNRSQSRTKPCASRFRFSRLDVEESFRRPVRFCPEPSRHRSWFSRDSRIRQVIAESEHWTQKRCVLDSFFTAADHQRVENLCSSVNWPRPRFRGQCYSFRQGGKRRRNLHPMWTLPQTKPPVVIAPDVSEVEHETEVIIDALPKPTPNTVE